jgi:hypothetical protein
MKVADYGQNIQVLIPSWNIWNFSFLQIHIRPEAIPTFCLMDTKDFLQSLKLPGHEVTTQSI